MQTTSGVFTVNGASFIPPTTPVLLQILSGARDANDLLPEGAVYPLPVNSTIEISMPGGVVGGGVNLVMLQLLCYLIH